MTVVHLHHRHMLASALLCLCLTLQFSQAHDETPVGFQGQGSSTKDKEIIRRSNPIQCKPERHWNLREKSKRIKKRSLYVQEPCWLPLANQQPSNESDKDLGILADDFQGEPFHINPCQKHAFYFVRSNHYDGNQTSDFRLYERFHYYEDEKNEPVRKDWFRNIYGGYRKGNSLDRSKAKVLLSFPGTLFWLATNTTHFLSIQRTIILDSFRVDGKIYDQYFCAVKTPERLYEFPMTFGLLDNYFRTCSVMRIDGVLARVDQFYVLVGEEWIPTKKINDCHQPEREMLYYYNLG